MAAEVTHRACCVISGLPANLLGTPAAVVPAGMADGLPVGVQVMGGRYTELRCLAVAEAIEQRLGPLTPINPVAG